MNSDELKAGRKRLGLSQADMGARLGLTQPQYSTLETGKRSIDEFEKRLNEIFGGNISGHTEIIRSKPEATTLTPAQQNMGALLRSRLVGVVPPAPINTTSSSPTNTNEPKQYTNYAGQPTNDKWFAQFRGAVCDRTVVRYKGLEGVVRNFEHSGIARYVVEVKGLWSVWPVDEVEVVSVQSV